MVWRHGTRRRHLIRNGITSAWKSRHKTPDDHQSLVQRWSGVRLMPVPGINLRPDQGFVFVLWLGDNLGRGRTCVGYVGRPGAPSRDPEITLHLLFCGTSLVLTATWTQRFVRVAPQCRPVIGRDLNTDHIENSILYMMKKTLTNIAISDVSCTMINMSMIKGAVRQLVCVIYMCLSL